MKKLITFLASRKLAIGVTLGVLLCLAVGAIATVKTGLPIGLIVGMSWVTDDVLVTKLLASRGVVDATTGLVDVRRWILAKTADYTVLGTEPNGTIFTTRGAVGAVNFTLPVASPLFKGKHYGFLNLVDQNMTVTGAPADTLIVDGDLTADSLAASTASHKIGAYVEAMCDGTSWIARGLNGGVTYTVAT